MTRFIAPLIVCALTGCASMQTSEQPPKATVTSEKPADPPVRLGNFSVGLAVKDLGASRAFYEKLGFHRVAGDPAQNWLILQNDTATIGLFHGPAFTRNVLTFNPGWDRNAATLPDFQDVRELQKMLKGRGLEPATPADETTTGPASFTLTDPDGNPIVIDQHVPRPRK